MIIILQKDISSYHVDIKLSEIDYLISRHHVDIILLVDIT